MIDAVLAEVKIQSQFLHGKMDWEMNGGEQTLMVEHAILAAAKHEPAYSLAGLPGQSHGVLAWLHCGVPAQLSCIPIHRKKSHM